MPNSPIIEIKDVGLGKRLLVYYYVVSEVNMPEIVRIYFNDMSFIEMPCICLAKELRYGWPLLRFVSFKNTTYVGGSFIYPFLLQHGDRLTANVEMTCVGDLGEESMATPPASVRYIVAKYDKNK